MHAHFHNTLNASPSLASSAADFVNTNPGTPGFAGDTVLVNDTEAALVDENGNAISVN